MRQFSELMDLSGRSALVTGGAGNIGRAAADVLAELGARTAILDLDESRCQEVADALSQTYEHPSIALPCDLEDDAAVAGVPDRLREALGGLDIIVHSAALVGSSDLGGWNEPFERQGLEAWRRALDVNLTAAFALVQGCAPLLRAKGRSSVICVGSIYGVAGPDMRLYEGTSMNNPAAYAASKGGLLQLTRWLATTLAPLVRVNAVSPGGVWRNQPEAFVARYAARTPLERMASEEDLKGAIGFLAGDLSAYVTGQNLLVDGGWTAW